MSKHNYSQYSNKKKNDNAYGAERKPNVASNIPVVEPAVAETRIDELVTAPEVKMVVETVDTVPLPKTVEGVVTNCAKLNVRAEPNSYADVVYVLDVMSEISIDVSKSNNEWFKVRTASGVEGYCMRKFVDARL